MRLNALDSNHFEGQIIALRLKRRGVGTLVPANANCASAGASIFFGGGGLMTGRPNRVAEIGARVGLHRIVRIGGRAAHPSEDERVTGGAGRDFIPAPRARAPPKGLADELRPILERHGLIGSASAVALADVLADLPDRVPVQRSA